VGHAARRAERRRAVRLRWRKRIWECRDDDCEVRTWTEQTPLAEPRPVLTARAGEWATDRVAALEGTRSSIARGFGVSWSTVWSAVERIGRARVDDADRVGPVSMVGFDETVMQPAHRRRRRRFVTAVVDVATGQLLDVFEGRDARQLRAWMATLAPSWLAQVQVVSVDPHEGYRSVVVGPHPLTRASSLPQLSHVTLTDRGSPSPWRFRRVWPRASRRRRQPRCSLPAARPPEGDDGRGGRGLGGGPDDDHAHPHGGQGGDAGGPGPLPPWADGARSETSNSKQPGPIPPAGRRPHGRSCGPPGSARAPSWWPGWRPGPSTSPRRRPSAGACAARGGCGVRPSDAVSPPQ
jgi:hypothetical protein